jgi:hypothetical protein
MWAAGQAIIWVSGGEFRLFEAPADVLALDPADRTWRRLSDIDASILADVQFVAGDVVVGVVSTMDETTDVEHHTAVATRLAAPGAG